MINNQSTMWLVNKSFEGKHFVCDLYFFPLVPFFRGCLHVKFHPGMELVRGWNHLCLWWNVSYCLHVFTEMKFHPGMNWTHPRMKDRDEISSRDEKKTKKTCKHFIPGWNFKISMFFNFWHMYSGMFSKFNKFEHKGMNIMKIRPFIKSEARKEKGWAQQVKNQKCKNIFIFFIIFFVKLSNDWNFYLL